jgi:hypothetical protein
MPSGVLNPLPDRCWQLGVRSRSDELADFCGLRGSKVVLDATLQSRGDLIHVGPLCTGLLASPLRGVTGWSQRTPSAAQESAFRPSSCLLVERGTAVMRSRVGPEPVDDGARVVNVIWSAPALSTGSAKDRWPLILCFDSTSVKLDICRIKATWAGRRVRR